MKTFFVTLKIDDYEERFSEDEIKNMIQENCLDHVDNAPVNIEIHKVKEGKKISDVVLDENNKLE